MAPIKLRRQTADGTFIDFEGDANDYAVVFSVHGSDPMMVMLQQTLFAETLQARLMPPAQPALPPAYQQAQHFLPPAHEPAASFATAPTQVVQPEDVIPTTRLVGAKRFNIVWTDCILPLIVLSTMVAVFAVLNYQKQHPVPGTAGDKKTQTAPAKPQSKPKPENAVKPFPFALP